MAGDGPSSPSPTISVPPTARLRQRPAPPESSDEAHEPHRTAPLSVIAGAVGSLQNAIFPAIAAAFGTGIGGWGLLIGLGVGLLIAVMGSAFSYIAWRRLTYTIGEQDIRVESGVLSRSARSVPYERIQDVSLEQKLLPRLLGLVAVKFETGAGGGEDLSLSYLTEAEGERLRELIRERRDDAETGANTGANTDAPDGEAAADARSEEGETLFAMGPRELFTFGLFEFSLAVFAVLAGLAQYADTFFDIEVWDVDLWRELAEEQGGWLFELGAYMQALAIALSLLGIVLIGSATGLLRTFAREWDFRLERTRRGFRRRRGLFTRTDVVMPVHRVQALSIGTRFVRYRLGWHSLKFVSLAQDAGSSNHVVAPFAKLVALDPIVAAAGFRRPDEAVRWHRAALAYRNVAIVTDLAIFAVIGVIAGVSTWINVPEYSVLVVAGIVALAAVSALAEWLAWRFKRHALEDHQIIAMTGVLAPSMQIATRVKLHSVEIAQGPIARHYGFATLNLGLAGGEFSIPGVPLERAREVRARVLETIAETDFSQLESARLPEAA